MSLPPNGDQPRELRLWPGITALLLLLVVRFGVPMIAPDAGAGAMIGGLVCSLGILIWWAFFSRVAPLERWGAFVLMAVVVAAATQIVDRSIAGAGMGRLFPILSVQSLTVALVIWAVATRRLSRGVQRAALVGVMLLATSAWALIRTDGITGEGKSQFAWRWSPTAEQKLLATAGKTPTPVATVTEKPVETPAAPVAVATPVAMRIPAVPAARMEPNGPDWPGFRGPNRDSKVAGVRIQTNWTSSPPVELWRHPVGPGWSSFAVRDGLIYTQEQRGESEVVACYKLADGKPVWTHQDTARFYESNGGAGPRGTPTLHGGRVYAFGATGILNALDAGTGAVIWTRNAATDTGAKLPGWGFTSSPLIVDDMVVVSASSRIAAFDLTTGNPRWKMQAGGGSYSSPQLMTIGGVAQIVLLSGSGATGVTPADGKVLWKHGWEGSTILQPALTADGALLITTGDMTGGQGTRRLAIAPGAQGWTAQEVWTSKGLKPYFNDLVEHKGYAYGFDGAILSCIDLKDGNRKWKGGRYGHGQMLLLSDQDMLLVLSEEGELAVVSASPDQFTEVARFHAMDDKTWNHPVLAGDVLLVRNGQEMVAFRLTLASGS